MANLNRFRRFNLWLPVLPAGDIILVMLPIIGGIGGLMVGPLVVVRKNMDKRSKPQWALRLRLEQNSQMDIHVQGKQQPNVTAMLR